MNSNRIDIGLKDIMHVKRLGQCLAQSLAIITIKNHYLDKIILLSYFKYFNASPPTKKWGGRRETRNVEC